jgi:murein DD-endopeptidase MepM/ murein hydrolase activator NlpD
MRIRFITVVLFFSIILIGFIGYLIPFNSFTLDVVERNQKRNLKEQNKRLVQRIVSTVQLLGSLKDEISTLQAQKNHLADLVETPPPKSGNRFRKSNFSSMQPAAMLRLVTERESQFQQLLDSVSSNRNNFLKLPVCRPVISQCIISRPFGRSKDPFTGKEKWHFGTDFSTEPGTPVVATADGIVLKVETDPLWGKKITISHDDGFRTVFAHLGTVSIQQGKEIKRGTVIGIIGESGLTSGPHVHYEIWHNGKALNPETYFFPSIDTLIESAGLASVSK